MNSISQIQFDQFSLIMNMQDQQKQEQSLEAEKDSDDGMNVVAGILRSLGRTAARALPKAGLGSFPMHGKHVISAVAKKKLSVKAIGKYTEQLSNLADYFEHWKNSHHDSHHSRGSLARLALRVKLMVPQIVKGSVLGTVVFETYDRLMDATDSNSLLSGAIAGLTHGVCYQIWGGLEWLAQQGLSKYSSSSAHNLHTESSSAHHHVQLKPTFLLRGPFAGTLVAHTIAHSSLFSAFEVSKHFLMKVVPSDEWLSSDQNKQVSVLPSQILGVAYIALAGALAGGISQSLSYYTEPLDKGTSPRSWVSWKQHWLEIRDMQWPRFKEVVRPSLLPSALGFLAYEYGKFQSDTAPQKQ